MDRKFDMQCVMRMGADFNLFPFPESYTEPVPMFLDFRNSFHRAIMVLDRNVSVKDIQLLKFQYEVKQSGAMYTISRDIPESPIVNKIHDIVNTRGASIVAIYLERGILKMKVKFHHTADASISEHLLSMSMDDENFHIDYLGPSEGIKKNILDLDRMFSLTALSFSVDEEASSQDTLARFPEGTIFELQNKAGANMTILAYPDRMDATPEGATEISRDDLIYETGYSHAVLNAIRSTAFSEGIVRYNYFGRLENGRVRLMILLLKSHLTAYLSVLDRVRKENPKWNLALDGVSHVRDSIFLDF